MLPEYFSVDVVMERKTLHNRWTTEQWGPAAVEAIGPGRPATPDAPPICIEDTPERSRWRFSGREIEVHPVEAEGYFLNVTSEQPVVFVMWRMREDGGMPAAVPWIVTVSYNEDISEMGMFVVDPRYTVAALPGESDEWLLFDDIGE